MSLYRVYTCCLSETPFDSPTRTKDRSSCFSIGSNMSPDRVHCRVCSHLPVLRLLQEHFHLFQYSWMPLEFMSLEQDPYGKIKQLILAAGCSGVCIACVQTPAELLKCRIQVWFGQRLWRIHRFFKEWTSVPLFVSISFQLIEMAVDTTERGMRWFKRSAKKVFVACSEATCPLFTEKFLEILAGLGRMNLWRIWSQNTREDLSIWMWSTFP